MDAGGWLVAGVVTLSMCITPVVALKQWRGEVRLAHDPLGLFGPRLWQAFSRATPLTGFLMPACFLLALPALIEGDGRPSWTQGALIVAVGLLFAMIAAFVAIALFNQPKALVPPQRREEPGLVEELRHGAGPPQAPVAQVQTEAPVADAPAAGGVTTYRSRSLVLTQCAIFGSAGVVGVALALLVVGADVAGIVISLVVAGCVLFSIYRALMVSIVVDDQVMVVTNVNEIVTIAWEDIERVEIQTEDGPGRHWRVVALVTDGDVVNLHALEGAQWRPRSHDAWARRVVAELNARRRAAR